MDGYRIGGHSPDEQIGPVVTTEYQQARVRLLIAGQALLQPDPMKDCLLVLAAMGLDEGQWSDG